MSTETFATWLRGFMAACGDTPLTAAQMDTIRAELAKVVPSSAVGPIVINPAPIYPMVHPIWVTQPSTLPPPMWDPLSPFGHFEITCDNGAKVVS